MRHIRNIKMNDFNLLSTIHAKNMEAVIVVTKSLKTNLKKKEKIQLA